MGIGDPISGLVLYQLDLAQPQAFQYVGGGFGSSMRNQVQLHKYQSMYE